jgi:Carboxypeptidase regulatory-like domain
VVGVEVMATHLSTGFSQGVLTNERGIYRFPGLEPGVYRVEAELSGFKKFSQEPITLRVEDIVRLDVQLEMGEVADVVSVTGGRPCSNRSRPVLEKWFRNGAFKSCRWPSGIRSDWYL